MNEQHLAPEEYRAPRRQDLKLHKGEPPERLFVDKPTDYSFHKQEIKDRQHSFLHPNVRAIFMGAVEEAAYKENEARNRVATTLAKQEDEVLAKEMVEEVAVKVTQGFEADSMAATQSDEQTVPAAEPVFESEESLAEVEEPIIFDKRTGRKNGRTLFFDKVENHDVYSQLGALEADIHELQSDWVEAYPNDRLMEHVMMLNQDALNAIKDEGEQSLTEAQELRKKFVSGLVILERFMEIQKDYINKHKLMNDFDKGIKERITDQFRTKADKVKAKLERLYDQFVAQNPALMPESADVRVPGITIFSQAIELLNELKNVLKISTEPDFEKAKDMYFKTLLVSPK